MVLSNEQLRKRWPSGIAATAQTQSACPVQVLRTLLLAMLIGMAVGRATTRSAGGGQEAPEVRIERIYVRAAAVPLPEAHREPALEPAPRPAERTGT